MFDNLLTIIAPHYCCSCGNVGHLLCHSCKLNIARMRVISCVLCTKPAIFGICYRHKVAYQQVWCVGIRHGTLEVLIDVFKFQRALEAARHLADLAHMILPQTNVPTVIVPIPTASPHIRSRGYDHMQRVAHYLSKKSGIPIRTLLTRSIT